MLLSPDFHRYAVPCFTPYSYLIDSYSLTGVSTKHVCECQPVSHKKPVLPSPAQGVLLH